MVIADAICSYIVATENISLDNLKKHLRDILPEFMVPSFITKLNSIPLNVSGKVDRKALPTPTIDSNRQIISARNSIDTVIIDELKQILKLDNISIKDSFFGIGGDSLIAITLSTRLSNRLNMSVTVKDIFDNPVIEHLSDVISKNNEFTQPKVITKSEEKDYYPLSSAQKRIYFANALAGSSSVVYNVSGGLLFKNILAPTKVQDALNKLISLHSSFRTVFTYKDGEPVQSIKDNVQISFEIEHTTLDAQKLVDSFPKPFNLEKAPLLRAKLYILEDSSSLLLLDTHHIVVDGSSLAIIFRDFCRLYNGEMIVQNELKYADYAVWEKDFISSPKILPLKEFWANKFKGQDFTALNLPYDYPLSNIKSYRGDKTSITLSDEQFTVLEEIAKSNNVSTYAIFLSALYVLLYKYTAQNNIIIGSPFAGRSFAEVQDLVGMFVNNIVLNKTIENIEFADFLKSVHTDVLDAISNQPYPYELLQKDLATRCKFVTS